MAIPKKVLNTQEQLLPCDQQAIVAQCTPMGSGAIALLRVCGTNAVALVDHVARLADGGALSTAPTHTIHYGSIIDPGIPTKAPGALVDRVLFLLMLAPRTFTGQDTVEITCHNNQFIVARIMQLLIDHGARPAGPGEFTRRAVLQGKIDLLQAEAINDLIHAGNPKMLEHSLAQLEGTLSHAMQAIEEQLFALLAHVEASFEFLDEEARDLDLAQQIYTRLERLQQAVQTVLGDHDAQTLVRNGLEIALLGSVNAGKSTLFNALLGAKRAIVSPQAGTTRDAIESTRYHNGMFWQLIDTAGLRTTSDAIEQEGIARSHTHAAKADVVLLVYDSSTPLDQEQQKLYQDALTTIGEKVILVANKADAWLTQYPASRLDAAPDIPHVTVSAHTTQGLAELVQALEQRINFLMENNKSGFILSKRQRTILSHLDLQLSFIANRYSQSIDYELVACQLHELLGTIAELTGKNISEKLLDTVLGSFCVGK